MTLKNAPVTIGLVFITTFQLIFGICLVTLAATKIGETESYAQKDYLSSRGPTCLVACV